MNELLENVSYKLDPVFQKWLQALRFSKEQTIQDTLMKELAQFYDKNIHEIRRISATALEQQAMKWQREAPHTSQEINSFYANSSLYPFELASWHTAKRDRSFLDIVIIAEQAKKKGLCRWLDFGGGIGSHTIYLLKQGFHVTYADISDEMLQFSKSRVKHRGLKANFVDLKKKPIEAWTSNQFDCVLALDVLEHLINPTETVQQLIRLLQTNGWLCAGVPPAPLPKHPMHSNYYRSDLMQDAREIGLNQYLKLSSILVFSKPEGLLASLSPMRSVFTIENSRAKKFLDSTPEIIVKPFEKASWLVAWYLQTSQWNKIYRNKQHGVDRTKFKD